jgi:hypothetical protein
MTQSKTGEVEEVDLTKNDAPERPFIDDLGIANKVWFRELESLDCLYSPPIGGDKVHEKDFLTLAKGSTVVASIATAHALLLHQQFGSDKDVLIPSTALVWFESREDFCVDKSLLPEITASTERIFLIVYCRLHAFLLEIHCASAVACFYDSLPNYYRSIGIDRTEIMQQVTNAVYPPVNSYVNGASVFQGCNNCVILSLLNLAARLQNAPDAARLRDIKNIDQNAHRLYILSDLLSTSDAGKILLHNHDATAVLNLLQTRAYLRNLQLPILDMRKNLSNAINDAGTTVDTDRNVKKIRHRLTAAIASYEKQYEKQFNKSLLLNTDLLHE